MEWQDASLSMCTITENIFLVLISIQSLAFWNTDFYTALYFVNRRTNNEG
jgi:hypothetical protein